MTIQKQLLLDIQKIEDSLLLNQLYQYVQLMKKVTVPASPNVDTILQFAGKIEDSEAKEMMNCIEHKAN